MSEEWKDELQDNDFKYVMADFGSLYLGARFTFGELLEQEMVPFKLKAVVNQYILKETAAETTLESQFYYLEQNTMLYEIFNQLKVRVKVNLQVERKSLFGKADYVYEEKILQLKELTEINLAKKKASGMIVREIVLSKLGLMTFSI